MEVVCFFRCLPFLMFVSGTTQGSEGKKFDEEVERYLEQHPDSRPLFERATPEKIERWKQIRARFDPLHKRAEDLLQKLDSIHCDYGNIFNQIREWEDTLNKIKGMKLKQSQDMISHETNEPLFIPGLSTNGDPNSVLMSWMYYYIVDPDGIYPSVMELDLETKIREGYARIDMMRNEQEQQRNSIYKELNKLEIEFRDNYAEIGTIYRPSLWPVQE